MTDVVVETSAWIDFFRGEKQAVDRIAPLVRSDRIAVTGAIIAEVTSGASTASVFHQLRKRLSALGYLADPSDLWDRVAEARFSLARRGLQAHLVDLVIAITTSAANHRLLTKDRDFEAIAQVVPLDLELLA